MESLSSVWTNLPAGRKLAVVLATLLAFGGVLALGQTGGSRNMSLLYGGLESSAAGEVLQALEASGVAHEVRGGAIYVDTAQRDSLRMTLAGQGLPANGAQGYELLDSLSGFSTTSQMFDAAYWRAREGELARTIITNPFVTSARVHISAPSSRGFQREQKPTAAVTVSTRDGAVSAAQAKAFRFLVASTVPGLLPRDVAIIDGQGGLVSFAAEDGTRQSQDMSADLRERVQRLLEARVGVGNVVVEIAIETVTETEQILERRIDPDSRIAISTDVTESTNAAQNAGGGDVTVASNLPDGDAAAGGENSSSQGAESRQVTNFEVSETQREIVRAPGAIRRITVAALVNDIEQAGADGSVTFIPRPAEEMDALRALIASAVGFDDQRGDEITIQSLSFEPLPTLGTEVAEATLPDVPLDTMALIRLGVMAAVALILGLFVVRPVLMSGSAEIQPTDTLAISDASAPNIEEDIDLPDIEMPDIDTGFMNDMGELPELGSFEQDPVDRLRNMIDDRHDETLQILQSWIEDVPSTENA